MTKEQENTEQEKTQDDSPQEFKNKVEGQKALDRLFKELDDKGLLVDPEQESQSTKELSDRVASLENEVSLLKDLIARALRVDTVQVLKD
jgi:hypothetical protein